MCRIESLLAPAFERGMTCHQHAVLEDADFVALASRFRRPHSVGNKFYQGRLDAGRNLAREDFL